MPKDQVSSQDDLWFLNGRLTFRRSAESGPDRVAIADQVMVQGDGPPLHRHEREDEVFHILDGVIRFQVGGTEIVAHAGETLVGPKGVPHTFRIESPTAHFLTITVGGDFEAFVHEMARPAGEGLPTHAEPTPSLQAALAEAAARNHIEVLGPPMAA